MAALLYIASLGFAKESVLALVKSITPVRVDRRVVYGFAGFILLWGVSAEFATAFVCGLPSPWDYLHGQCHESGMRVCSPRFRMRRHTNTAISIYGGTISRSQTSLLTWH